MFLAASLPLVLLFHCCTIVHALSASNRTIDDYYGDEVTGVLPSYSSTSQWDYGPTCQTCLARPDAKHAYRGSWHDSTHLVGDSQPSVLTLTFDGIAVFVHCILANQVLGADTATNVTFLMDGHIVGSYVHVPKNTTDFEYDVPVYVNTSLPNGRHTLSMATSGDVNSLVLFDYAMYTVVSADSTSASPSPPSPSLVPTGITSNSRSPSKPNPNLPAILGGVLGGIGLILLIILVSVFLAVFGPRRHKPKDPFDDRHLENAIEPFPPPPSPHLPPPLQPLLPSRPRLPSRPLPPTPSTPPAPCSLAPSNIQQRHEITPPPTVLQNVASVFPLSEKAARRREELLREIRERERHVAQLQAAHLQQQQRLQIGGAPWAPITGPISPSTDDMASALRRQMEVLRREVQMLQEEQRRLAWELNAAGPPQYEDSDYAPSSEVTSPR